MATLVHRLRIRSPERDTHSVKARVTAQLAAADMAPAALPPGATLVVRRIDGLPPWKVHPLGIRPPREWQAALSERLDVLLRRAVRARRGAIPEDAEAILFLDEAEMLAEMTLDWMGGRLESRWCWRTLHPRAELTGAMLRAWVERPEYVPAAMDQLAVLRHAETFVQRIPAPVMEKVTREVIRVFGLRLLEPVFEMVFRGAPRPAPPWRAVAPAQATETAATPQPDAAVPAEGAPAAPAVASRVARPEIAPLLSARQAFLIEMARELQRSPAAARTPAFAARLASRLAADPVRETAGAPPSDSHVEERAAPDQTAEPPESNGGPHVRKSMADPIGIIEFREETSAQATDDAWLPAVPVPIAPPSLVEAPAIEAVEIETEFGGIFYLINVALYLGYYGDFSTPEEPGIDLPIWDFLALTGSELVGKPLLDDPVWPLLLSLGEGRSWDGLETAIGRISEWIAGALPPCEDVAGFVLRHAARVRLTGTRLDIFLSLQELPISIRLARLDRDPGWIPAVGRFVAFHFR